MGKDRSVLTIGTEIDIATIPGGIPGCLIRSAALRKLSHNEILIYIGTENGKILLLSWDPSSSDSVLLACRAVGRIAVKGIYSLQDSNILALLAGESVFLIDGYLHGSLRPLSFTKGASAMTTRMLSPGQKGGEGDEEEEDVSKQAHGFLHKIGMTNRKVSANRSGSGRKSQTSQMAIAAGRRLFVCEVDSEQKGEGERDIVVSEIACPEGVVSMGWVDNSIILGTQDGYALIALGEEEEEGEGRGRGKGKGKGKGRANLSPIFALPDAAPPPLLKCFHDDRELLLIVDNVGIVVNVSGQPTAGSVVFKASPDSIGQTGSYVVTAKNGQVEVYHRKTGFRVQSLSLTASGHSVIADDIDGKFVVVATQSKVLSFN